LFDPFVKTVVSGGYSTDPVVANFRQYGFVGILTTPYMAGRMSEIIKKGLFEKKVLGRTLSDLTLLRNQSPLRNGAHYDRAIRVIQKISRFFYR
jgi:hypothetical protein